MFFQLLGDDVPAGDLGLFQVGIAGEIDDLHPVQKRSGNGAFVIGCGNKQNIAQVKGQFNEMIPEGCILLSVKDLQQSRSRVTLIITAKLVDFIDQNQAIAAPRLAQSSDDPSGHGADICLSMTANLRFVPNAAQAQTGIIPPHTPGDGLGHRGFSHTGRARKAENLPFDSAGERLHREKLQNTLFNLFQTVVILVQDGPGLLDVVVFLFHVVPGEIETNIQIIPGNAALRGGGLHLAQTLGFLDELVLYLLGEMLFGNFGQVFLCLAQGVLPFPQLFVDGLDLLPQVIIPLALVHLDLDLVLDVLLQLEDVGLLGKHPQQKLHPPPGILGLQQELLFVKAHLGVLGDVVRKLAQVAPGHDLHHHVAGHLGQERRIGDKGLLGRTDHGHVPLGPPAGLDLRQELDIRRQKGGILGDALEHGPLPPLNQNADVVPRDAEDLPHPAIGADAEQIVLTRVVHPHVTLGHQKDALAIGHGVFHGLDGLLPPHVKVEERTGKDRDTPQSQRWDLGDGFVGSGCLFHEDPPWDINQKNQKMGAILWTIPEKR